MNRADYVRRYYALTLKDRIWTARAGNADAISSSSKEEVIREARCQWGHFNYTDEAEAFDETFPPQGFTSSAERQARKLPPPRPFIKRVSF